VYKPLAPWRNVSRRGEDFKKGEKIMDKGDVIEPHHIAVLSATGNTSVSVLRKPVVSVISTGNELIEPEVVEANASTKIPDSNRYMILSSLKKLNTIPLDMGIVPDNPESIRDVLEKSLKISDIVIFSGGTSVGKKDLVPEIVNDKKDGTFIHGLAIKPGMPTGIAVCDGKPVLLLPGFPVACYIAFNLVFPKILQRVYGVSKELKLDCKVLAYARRRIPSQAGIRTFTRVSLKIENGRLYAEPLRTSGSGLLSTLLHADGIVEVEEEKEGYEEGEVVEVKLISW
jgi:molybdenum cofactor synthesis domain-containing protein